MMSSCPDPLLYTIQQGDNLYHLAKFYQTSVSSILSLNPHTDPYDLQIGTQLKICPGEHYGKEPLQPMSPIHPSLSAQIDLLNRMRTVWMQHVYWTRMLLISIADRLKDLSAVTARLLQNPYDIAGIYAAYYPSEAVNLIARLLTEHLQIGAALITALRDKQTAAADRLNRQWYQNADKMSEAFASISPYYNLDELRKMFYTHLDLTTKEVSLRLAKHYQDDIKAFGNVEQEALSMADYFSKGIMKQFPQEFI